MEVVYNSEPDEKININIIPKKRKKKVLQEMLEKNFTSHGHSHDNSRCTHKKTATK